jgi:hypothetical protein
MCRTYGRHVSMFVIFLRIDPFLGGRLGQRLLRGKASLQILTADLQVDWLIVTNQNKNALRVIGKLLSK